jgi:hypothetical protein
VSADSLTCDWWLTDWVTYCLSGKLPLILDSTVILGSRCCGTHDQYFSISLLTAEVKVKVMLHLTVSQSILVSSPMWGPRQVFCYCHTCRFIDVGRPLWREDGSAIYSCCWLLPVQPFLDLEYSGTHDHILLSWIQESPNLEDQVPYSYPSGIGWSSYTPRHWVPFSSPPMTRGYGGGAWTCLHISCVCPFLLVHVI